jgi:predicted DNA-binding transcriptional regulator YafY
VGSALGGKRCCVTGHTILVDFSVGDGRIDLAVHVVSFSQLLVENAMSKFDTAARTILVSIDSIDDASDSIADAVRSVFAGVPKVDRKAIQREFYKALRALYSGPDNMFSVRELKALADAGDQHAGRVLRAYVAARKAVSRLFGKSKTKRKAETADAPSTTHVIPLTRDGMREWLNAAIAAVQGEEAVEFDATRLVAAFRATLDIL